VALVVELRGEKYMKKVLVVDDALFMRVSIKKTLIEHDFEVVGEAVNGFDAIEKYKELRPDIVTMDITMPELTGIDALKAIMEFDANAKIVMITALGQEEMVRQAIVLGAKSFIVKPFKEEQIVSTLNKFA